MMQQLSSDLTVLDDEALMAQVASGNSRALEQLYDRYARSVYGLALRMLANAEYAEDIVQETFWRIWRRSATFRHGYGQFAPWLFGIAHNLCIDELRRQKSRPTPAHADDTQQVLYDLPDSQHDMDTLTWQSERRRLITGALRDLPPDQRQVIELAYFGGLSQREIAERLQDPLGTVKTRIRLGLQKLKQLLQAQGVDHSDR
jgi:RNA polymerase sigma-70 factor (ECF subfamily)